MEKINPWVTQYGPDPDSWNHEDREDFDSPSYNMPGKNIIGRMMAFYDQKNPSNQMSNEELAELFCLPTSMLAELEKDAFGPADPFNAIMCWCALRVSGKTSVADIALVFRVETDFVIKSVQDGFLSFLSGDVESGDPTKIFVEEDGL